MDLHCSHLHAANRRIVLFVLPFVTLVLLLVPVHTRAAVDLLARVDDFNRQYEQLIDTLYQARATALSRQGGLPSTIKALDQQVNAQLKNDNVVEAMALMQAGIDVIKDNIDSRLIFGLLRNMLDYGDTVTANELYGYIKSQNEKSLTSNVAFVFATRALKFNQWQTVIDELQDTYQDLPENDGAYARLITGVALQKLKRHREAIKFYNEIPAGSRYYTHAGLNTAIAYLRQGWWTDAQLTINDTVNTEAANKPDEMINRLNLVLGYALLQQEYYRDARDAFRRVALDSRYTSRALLGLALAAANQTDYIGALNALDRLKQKSVIDLSVDESHLLLPYVYQKLDQQLTASANYSSSIEYYEQRLTKLKAIAADAPALSLNELSFSDNRRAITIGDTRLEYAEIYPPIFLDNLGFLTNLLKHGETLREPDRKRLETLNTHGQSLLRDILATLITQREEYLGSYLNQCRYGLANLYDSSLFNDN